MTGSKWQWGLPLFLFVLTAACASPQPRPETQGIDWSTELSDAACTDVMKGFAPRSDFRFKTSFEGCAFFLSRLHLGDVLSERLLDLDACAPSFQSKGKGWSEPSVHPLAIASAIEPVGVKIRERLIEQFKGLLSQTAEACCAGDGLCLNALMKTGIKWCSPPDDPKSVAPCKEGGIFTQMSEVSWKAWQGQRVRALAKKNPLPLDEISVPEYEVFISQRYDSSTLEPLTNIRVMAHELAHACVNVRNFSRIKAGSRDVLMLVNDLGWPKTSDGKTDRCQPTSAHHRAWLGLAVELGLGGESISCLDELSRLTAITRFQKGGECAWPCANDVWTEALVDWIHFQALSREDWIPHLFPNYCTYRRDGSHALPADQLACFLLTPRFKDRVIANLGCRQGS